MPRWEPEPIWEGRDAYVVGGGTSLDRFDWRLLRGRPAIGCNSAFVLGHEVVPFVVFGDSEWWDTIGREAEPYVKGGGRLVGCHPDLELASEDWLSWIPSVEEGGLTDRPPLCWNGNTGVLALNLALILGARRVFLLGFDMGLGKDGRANWHDKRHQAAEPDVYPRFVDEFLRVVKLIPAIFPGREVVNVHERDTLPFLPRVSPSVHFALEPAEVR